MTTCDYCGSEYNSYVAAIYCGCCEETSWELENDCE